jgi:Phage tail tube protein
MAGRAFGANARRAVAFEASYGAIPAAGSAWKKLAFVSSALGEEGGLIEDGLLGLGREPQDPTDDVLNNTGDVVVPVDARAFGYWLMLYFGAPTSGDGDAATGRIVFAA